MIEPLEEIFVRRAFDYQVKESRVVELLHPWYPGRKPNEDSLAWTYKTEIILPETSELKRGRPSSEALYQKVPEGIVAQPIERMTYGLVDALAWPLHGLSPEGLDEVTEAQLGALEQSLGPCTHSGEDMNVQLRMYDHEQGRVYARVRQGKSPVLQVIAIGRFGIGDSVTELLPDMSGAFAATNVRSAEENYHNGVHQCTERGLAYAPADTVTNPRYPGPRFLFNDGKPAQFVPRERPGG